MPLRHNAVGWQARMEWAGGGTIDIRDVAPRNGAQAADVEVSVLALERIEGPFDPRNSSRQSVLPLGQLKLPPNSKIAKLREHGSHVRMEVGPAIANSRIGQNEPGQFFSDERTQHLSTDLVRNHVHLRRHNVPLA